MISDIASAILLVLLCATIVLWIWGRFQQKRSAKQAIVLDGSNILHWKDGTPDIETLRDVIRHLQDAGFDPGVVFDANVGYLIQDRFLPDRVLARMLGLDSEKVMVVEKGTPADPAILTAARDLGCPIVTCDRYRDWADAFPEVAVQGHLIRGGYRAGELWLDV